MVTFVNLVLWALALHVIYIDDLWLRGFAGMAVRFSCGLVCGIQVVLLGRGGEDLVNAVEELFFGALWLGKGFLDFVHKEILFVLLHIEHLFEGLVFLLQLLDSLVGSVDRFL